MRFIATDRGDGHDAGDDRRLDAGKFATLPEIEEVAIVEKELGDDVVSSGISLALEIVHLQEAIRSRGMALRKTGDTDAETTAVGMGAGGVELLDVGDEVGRVGKSSSALL